MTLKIDLSPELQARLKEVALSHGLDEAEYARQLIESNVAPAPVVRDQATLDLLAQWDAEERTMTPQARAEAEREWEEFKKAMNEDSMSGRPIYP